MELGRKKMNFNNNERNFAARNGTLQEEMELDMILPAMCGMIIDRGMIMLSGGV